MLFKAHESIRDPSSAAPPISQLPRLIRCRVELGKPPALVTSAGLAWLAQLAQLAQVLANIGVISTIGIFAQASSYLKVYR